MYVGSGVRLLYSFFHIGSMAMAKIIYVQISGRSNISLATYKRDMKGREAAKKHGIAHSLSIFFSYMRIWNTFASCCRVRVPEPDKKKWAG